MDFIRAEIDEHKKNWDPSEGRDYIDCYLKEIETVSYTIQSCAAFLMNHQWKCLVTWAIELCPVHN